MSSFTPMTSIPTRMQVFAPSARASEKYRSTPIILDSRKCYMVNNLANSASRGLKISLFGLQPCVFHVWRATRSQPPKKPPTPAKTRGRGVWEKKVGICEVWSPRKLYNTQKPPFDGFFVVLLDPLRAMASDQADLHITTVPSHLPLAKKPLPKMTFSCGPRQPRLRKIALAALLPHIVTLLL